jgi:NAD(P)H-dependent FMN reductase
MADTTFTAQVTKILASWLQDVNDLVYRGIGTGGPATPFLQSGTGAVARTAQEKMREIVSAFDYMSATEIADVQA